MLTISIRNTRCAPTMDPLLDLQKETTDFFNFWRAGNVRDWHRADRQREIQDLEFPLPGNVPAYQADREAARLEEFGVNPVTPRGRARAEAGVAAFTDTLNPRRFTFKKLLGWGSFGVAARYDLESSVGTVPVVIKAGLDARSGIAEEKRKYVVSRARA